MSIVHATSKGQAVSLKPGEYLDDAWDRYIKAIRGSVFDRRSKSNLVPRHAWPMVALSLADAGFTVEPDETAEGWVAEEAERASMLMQETIGRLHDFQTKLRIRGLALREYQKTGALWLANRHAGFLLDEQGTGKTIQALAAIPIHCPVIIVCPASLRGLWRDEIRKWRPELLVTMVLGDFCEWPSENQVYIMSEATVRQIVSLRPWPAHPKNLYLISDECQMFKGNNLRTSCMQLLCAEVRRYGGWTVGLTGTPLMNHPRELFTLSLVFGCMRLAFGSWAEYTRDWQCTKGRFNETIWGQPKSSVRENLASVGLRRTRAEVMPELPPKVYQTIPVDLKKRLYAILNKVGEEIYPQLDTWATSDKLPPFERYSEVWSLLTKAKIDDMLDWADRVEDNEEPALIFSMHLAPLERLKNRSKWALITGTTKPEERTAIVKAFQGGDLRGVGLSIRAGGTGLTLTRAAFELFVDLSPNPFDNLQAEDRAMRYGQKRTLQISTLVADHPLDRRIAEIIRTKQAMADRVM